MATTTLKTKTDYISKFNEALQAGVDNFIRAAQIYVNALDDDPAWRLRFREAQPKLPWANFEAVGRGTMHVGLLLEPNGQNVAAIRKLPMSMQKEIVAGHKYPMLTASNDVLEVDLRVLTREQKNQMFNGSELRTVPEQKLWRESNKHREPADPVETMPYIITGGKVRFKRNVELNKKEVQRILMEM